MFGELNETIIYVENRTDCINLISEIPEELIEYKEYMELLNFLNLN